MLVVASHSPDCAMYQATGLISHYACYFHAGSTGLKAHLQLQKPLFVGIVSPSNW